MKESAGQHSLLFIILAVVVCIGLGFVIGFLWSVLILVLAVMLIKKANGGPVDGYCMAHLRKKLPLALLGALYVRQSICLGGPRLSGQRQRSRAPFAPLSGAGECAGRSCQPAFGRAARVPRAQNAVFQHSGGV